MFRFSFNNKKTERIKGSYILRRLGNAWFYLAPVAFRTLLTKGVALSGHDFIRVVFF